MIVHPDGPRIDRSLHLSFKADWGNANLTRVCGWLVQELGDRAGAHTSSTIVTGRGGADAIFAVGRGEVDFALCTPAAFATMAIRGVGPFHDETFPELRALAVIPQNDRLIVALDASLGIRSFAELREHKPKLTLAASPNDGTNFVGLATHELMAASGIDDATFASWGGRYLEDERPFPCLERYGAGDADGVIHEAISHPLWTEVLSTRDTVFLAVEELVLEALEEQFGWPRGTMAAGWFSGFDETLLTLSFRDFLLFTRSDLADDVAYLLAWCLCQTSEELERGLRHLPPKNRPIDIPLEPAFMCETPIPLHAGAARYYSELGLI